MPAVIVPAPGSVVVVPGGSPGTVVAPGAPGVVLPVPSAAAVTTEGRSPVSVPVGIPGAKGNDGDPAPDPVFDSWAVGFMNPFSGPLDSGTGGEATLTGSVIGGWFFGNLTAFVGDDHDFGGAFVIMMDPMAFPYIPQSPPTSFGYPSDFGYIVATETSPGASDGWKHTVVPSTTTFGFPGFENLFGMIRGEAQGSGVTTGIEALWSGQLPVNLTSRSFRYNGSIRFKIQE